MTRPIFRKTLTLAAVFLGLWVVIRYFLPVLLPFFLGGGLALAAEPLIRFLNQKLRLRRGIAAGIGITMAFALLVLALMILGALAVRELSMLSGILPQAQEMVRTGLSSLQDLFLSLAARLPESISALPPRRSWNCSPAARRCCPESPTNYWAWPRDCWAVSPTERWASAPPSSPAI